MLRLPTTLLRHTARGGSHYDWLLANPCDPEGLLWTGRTTMSSASWAAKGRWTVQSTPPHRRIYLDYQGAISAGRGAVVRVDQGWFVPLLWTRSRIVIDLQLVHCQGRVELRLTGGTLWIACGSGLGPHVTTDAFSDSDGVA